MAQRWRDGPNVRLRTVIRASGLTQAEVARRVALSETTISKYLKTQAPNADVLASILEVVGGSADQVLGLSERVAEAQALALQRALGEVEKLHDTLAGPAGRRRP